MYLDILMFIAFSLKYGGLLFSLFTSLFRFFLFPWNECTAARIVSIARKLQAYIFDIVVFLHNTPTGHRAEGIPCDI